MNERWFSGRTWQVKDSGTNLVGPGPNLFRADNVTVNRHGSLLLSIRRTSTSWSCAEVHLPGPLGHGRYHFTVAALSPLHPAVVLGLFLYANDFREIDVEHARWRKEADPPAVLHTVQPLTPGTAPRSATIRLPPGSANLTHTIDWDANHLRIETRTERKQLLGRSTFAPPTPTGALRVHLNLWIWRGVQPADRDLATTVAIERFRFEPQPTS